MDRVGAAAPIHKVSNVKMNVFGHDQRYWVHLRVQNLLEWFTGNLLKP